MIFWPFALSALLVPFSNLLPSAFVTSWCAIFEYGTNNTPSLKRELLPRV